MTPKKEDKKQLSKQNSKKIDYIHALGRRKSSSARVRIHLLGKGKTEINQKELNKYFTYQLYKDKILEPFKEVGLENKFDVTVKVIGGGINSQAEAIRHGISRALIKYDPEFKPTLRAAGFLTRDPRAKERKKPGLKRARRRPQWSKR